MELGISLSLFPSRSPDWRLEVDRSHQRGTPQPFAKGPPSRWEQARAWYPPRLPSNEVTVLWRALRGETSMTRFLKRACYLMWLWTGPSAIGRSPRRLAGRGSLKKGKGGEISCCHTNWITFYFSKQIIYSVSTAPKINAVLDCLNLLSVSLLLKHILLSEYNNTNTRAKTSGSNLQCVLVVWPGESYPNSLCLYFVFSETRIIIFMSQDSWGDQILYGKVLYT